MKGKLALFGNTAGPPTESPDEGDLGTTYIDADGVIWEPSRSQSATQKWGSWTRAGQIGAQGAHPDLTTHNTLGLATQAELDGHNHAGVYAATSHAHVDADIPAGIARDTEVTAAVSAHEAAADPHTVYLKENDANWTDLTDGGATTLHSHAGGGGEAFPVGAVFIAAVSTNPATLLGYGTWSAFGAGRMLVGLDAGDAAFDTVEETGGAKTHTHAAHSDHAVTQPAAHTEVINHTHPITDPGHVHDEYRNSATTGGLDGWGAGDTSTNTPLVTGYDTGSKVTGITVNNPAGGVASIPHSGAAVDAHSAHDSPGHLPPYLVVYMWKRTA